MATESADGPLLAHEPGMKYRPERPLHVLAMEPYFDGSHAAFLERWMAHSRHAWTLLSLPGHHWKWRMRHASATFADQVAARPANEWDVLFTTSMLNLAEFRGLAPASAGRLPAVVYFHENQLTYPVRHEDRRDLHFALSHVMTLRAANAVWFNSRFHQDSFATALQALLRRMPDDALRGDERLVAEKGTVEPPGVDTQFHRGPRKPGPPRILWAARWEFDKNPELFFRALGELDTRGTDFRISVLGRQYSDVPAVFEEAHARFADRIDHWGYQPTLEAYRSVLEQADIVVSTADHEFFGIGVVEAMAAGAVPLLPRRLSYPELLEPLGPAADAFFYDSDGAGKRPETLLADALETRISLLEQSRTVRAPEEAQPADAMSRFDWSRRAAALDDAIEDVAERASSGE